MSERKAAASWQNVTGQKSSRFPNQFQRESLALVHGLIHIRSSAFYLLDADMSHKGVALYNIGSEVEKEYQKTFRVLDPLNPRKFDHTEDKVVTLDSQISFEKLRQTIYYQEFMQQYDHRYVADMFFRYEGEVIAVLSMLRHESDGPYTEPEISLLGKFQPFMEYALNNVYLPKKVEDRLSLKDRFQLTQRELDVLELVIAGASNKTLAKELGLGLATIKTHLQHIFQKTGVTSRTELLSEIISHLKPDNQV